MYNNHSDYLHGIYNWLLYTVYDKAFEGGNFGG